MISLKLTETKKNLCLNFFLSELFDHFSFSLKVILSPLTASILMVIFKKFLCRIST